MRVITLLFIVAITCTACKKDQAEIAEFNKNCSCAKEVTAEFMMEELTYPGINVRYTETDTIHKEKNVRFTPIEKNAVYTWYMGTEILTDSVVQKYFDESLAGGNLPITLVVKKPPNKICLPNDDGYDSITKYLHVSNLPIWNSPDAIVGPIEGNFRVKSEHLPDSFDINIDITYIPPKAYFNITNYDGMGSSCIQQARPTDRNYRQMWGFDGVSTSQCDAMKGDVHVKMDGMVEMNFEFFHHPDYPGYAKRQYLGRKI
ncbi:hypothetical protein DNU06_02780 [Putridiphycobacter roseus]|uniref:Uncharacterized protein n=1 Tax=Putridiphycobacter roseus TaxID=2219161 RepID=A0A2W1N6J9_9FLAO|nr:hypothetical protein [Putridiphycobacter roseus]PZE18771.1 hypothetical protein DNU06_02780 [Putridiphycobacter roseus]